MDNDCAAVHNVMCIVCDHAQYSCVIRDLSKTRCKLCMCEWVVALQPCQRQQLTMWWSVMYCWCLVCAKCAYAAVDHVTCTLMFVWVIGEVLYIFSVLCVQYMRVQQSTMWCVFVLVFIVLMVLTSFREMSCMCSLCGVCHIWMCSAWQCDMYIYVTFVYVLVYGHVWCDNTS